MILRIVPAVLAALLTTAIQVSPAAADDVAEIAAVKAAMLELDEAFQNQHAPTIRSLMTRDHRAVTFYYLGPQTVDDQIASLPDLMVDFYDFSEPSVTLLGPDAALATFEHSYRGTFKGNPVPDRVFVSAIWVKGEGAWRERFYQETMIEPE